MQLFIFKSMYTPAPTVLGIDTTSFPIPTPTVTLIPTPTPTIQPSPTQKPTTAPTPTYRKPPANPLLSQVNLFRKSNNLEPINTHSLLCSIAKERVEFLATRGSLDNHAGYKQYWNSLSSTFGQWWETLFFGSPPRAPHDIVFTHWSNSPGHRASLLSTATHGCGAEKNGYAVFELGRK